MYFPFKKKKQGGKLSLTFCLKKNIYIYFSLVCTILSQQTQTSHFWLFQQKQKILSKVLDRKCLKALLERKHENPQHVRGYAHQIVSYFKESADIKNPPTWKIKEQQVPWIVSSGSVLRIQQTAEQSAHEAWDIIQISHFPAEETFQSGTTIVARTKNRQAFTGRGRGGNRNRGRGQFRNRGRGRNKKRRLNTRSETSLIPLHLVPEQVRKIMFVPAFGQVQIIAEGTQRRQQTIHVDHNQGLIIHLREEKAIRWGLKQIANTNARQQPFLMTYIQLKREVSKTNEWWLLD
jgi:hypothetical protein